MNFKTYNDLSKCIVSNLNKIPPNIDLVVGIPRSGTMVANMLALYLNLPFTDVASLLRGGELRAGYTKRAAGWIKKIEDAKTVLVVDDSVSSGKAIKEAKEQLKDCPYQLIWMAVYVLPFNKNMVDIWFEVCNQPRMFEWNFMHHWALENCCMDIDGVLCEDPKWFENDDGEKYKAFLKNTRPKLVPTKKVGVLVSCRLEKYREDTERWLKEYNILYDKLVLMNGITAKERALIGGHANFKAEVYKKSGAILFIESDNNQAIEICQITGKPVLCIENMQLINSDNIGRQLITKTVEIQKTGKQIVKKLIWMTRKNKE
ncbi:MAG: phosphoribosyltransferase [Lachnospiraceae bacterium]|nr:phosphoribosyltransferase [Lachnospiraceae bacterium]